MTARSPGIGSSPQAKHLLISRIGRKSLHSNWLLPSGSRQFDVVLSAYDPAIPPIGGAGVHFEYRPGHKVEGYAGFLRDRRELWRNYEYICIFDEDLEADTETLNRMFALCRAHGFKIAQPALSHDSYFTYAALLRQPEWILRHVNFIEMMCPVFRRDTLEYVAPLFSMGFESGIDLVWCNLVCETSRDFAVLDSTPVHHTEPVGSNKAANGFTDGRAYEDDIHDILKQFDLSWLSCTPFSAISRSGQETRSRLRFFLAALALLAAVPRQRPLLPRLRSVLVHLRHIVTRPARNSPVGWSGDETRYLSALPDLVPRGMNPLGTGFLSAERANRNRPETGSPKPQSGLV